MAKDIITKAEILGGEIDVRANFGQTVKVTVSPDPYMGDTEVTPSAETQVLATKKKFVQEYITINPAPTETLATSENGTFTPSSGNVGFSEVTVDVEPSLDSLSVTENGLYLPESGTDGFDRVTVAVPAPDLRPLSVTENGTYQPDGFDGYSGASVDVPDKYLIAEWVEEVENLAFCQYWTDKIPNIDIVNNIYVMVFYGNTHSNGVQILIYGERPNDDYVIAIRHNAFRVIDNAKPNDRNTYDLFVSAGTTVRLFEIPKIAS